VKGHRIHHQFLILQTVIDKVKVVPVQWWMAMEEEYVKGEMVITTMSPLSMIGEIVRTIIRLGEDLIDRVLMTTGMLLQADLIMLGLMTIGVAVALLRHQLVDGMILMFQHQGTILVIVVAVVVVVVVEAGEIEAEEAEEEGAVEEEEEVDAMTGATDLTGETDLTEEISSQTKINRNRRTPLN
jgi:hypothetical protein